MPLFFILDISRLLSRSGAFAPTGIDRVELAYARYLLDNLPTRSGFCAMHPLSFMGAIKYEAAAHFIKALSSQWAHQTAGRPALIVATAIQRDLLWRRVKRRNGAVYLNVSHHHLTRQRTIKAFLRKTGARFVAMLHDVIPIDFPEYARPSEPLRHKRRVETVTQLADAVIVPSTYVKTTLIRHLGSAIRTMPIWSVPHGVDYPCDNNSGTPDQIPEIHTLRGRPYFVCLSTIEPRKNHLLLLHLWRRMVDQLDAKAPVLVLIGKRGWENENVVDLLERAPALRDHVIECNAIADVDVHTILRGSKGLLFPTFVEGFGLPVVESFIHGVPVLCSDIPVLHEVGGEVAEYLDPLNAQAWQDAILDYSNKGARQLAQLRRMQTWRPVSWEKSVELAFSYIETEFSL
ncbi:glycosyltransferase family 4 protein [Asaia siamensis]